MDVGWVTVALFGYCRSLVRAGSASVSAVVVGFTSLQLLPCAPAPATTKGACWLLMVRDDVQVRAVIRVVGPSTALTTVSIYKE